MTNIAGGGAHLSAEHPFPGLRPFDFPDSAFFFGREEQVFALYRLLDRSRFLAVIGSSGSGKSSLVRAGLLPLLRNETLGRGGRVWRVADPIRPGDDPIERLADALAKLAPRGTDDAEASVRRERIELALNESSFGIENALAEIPDLGDETVVLVVDQFEELFRYARAGDDTIRTAMWREEAASFVQLLLEGSRSRKRSINIVITMRSDFIGDCSQFQGLPEAVSAAQFLVPSLTRDQREDVIRKPLERAGATIEPLLVQRLLNDVDTELDQLPVLQHTLLRLWESVPSPKHLDVYAYDDIGGAANALSQHADEVMDTLRGREVAVEQVFRALSQRDKEGRATRRDRTLQQLIAESGVLAEDVVAVVDRFRADDCSFIVPAKSAIADIAPETRVDVSHEALLRRWMRISSSAREVDGTPVGWLAKEEEDGRHYRALLSLAQTSRGDVAVKLPIDQVDEQYAWWTERNRTPAWTERYGGEHERVDRLFFDSLAARDEDAREREAQRAQRDADRLERERMARDNLRRTRRFAVIFGILAILSIGFGIFAWTETIASQKLVRLQRAEGLAYLSGKQDDTRVAGLLATEAFSAGSTPVTKGALLEQLGNYEGLHRLAMPVWAAGALADHDNTLVLLTGAFTKDTAEKHGALWILDAETLDVHAIVPDVHASLLCGMPDAERVVIYDGGTLAQYGLVATQPKLERIGEAQSVGALSALTCAGGNAVIAAKPDGTIAQLDLGTASSTTLARVANVSGLTLSPSGHLLAAVADGGHHIVVVSLDAAKTIGTIAVAEPPMSCTTYTCASAVRIRADDAIIGWFDSAPNPAVWMAQIKALGNARAYHSYPIDDDILTCYASPSEREHLEDLTRYARDNNLSPVEMAAARVLLSRELAHTRRMLSGRLNPGMIFRDGITFPQLMLPTLVAASYDSDAKKYTTDDSCDPIVHGPVALPNRLISLFTTAETDGVANRPIAGGFRFPLLGGLGVSQVRNYALHDNFVVQPLGGATLYWGDLDHWRKNKMYYQLSENWNFELSDAQDDRYAVLIRQDTGDVELIDISASPGTVLATYRFDTHLLREHDGKEVYDATAGYDQTSRRLRVATSAGLAEFDLAGDAPKFTLQRRPDRPWATVLHGLPGSNRTPLKNVLLTSRGNALIFYGGSESRYIVDTGGRTGPVAFSAVWQDIDERFAVGKQSGDAELGLFPFPALERIKGLNLDGDGPGGVSPDGQTIAYIKDNKVMLFDRNARREIGELPAPADIGSFYQIRFSPDGRFLAVSYDDDTPSASGVVALYDIDPADWESYLCHVVRRYRGDNGVVSDIDPQWTYQDACNTASRGMIGPVMPSPKPSPSASPESSETTVTR